MFRSWRVNRNLKLLKDGSWSQQAKAARRLGKLRDVQAIGPLMKAATAIKHFSSDEEDMDYPRAAREALKDFGPEAYDSVLQALESNDYSTRGIAAETLGYLGDDRAFEVLVKCLGDKESNVRRGAVESLGVLAGSRAEDSLLQALDQESDDFVVSGIVETLGNIGSEKSAKAISRFIRFGDWSCRGRVLEALGKLADKSTIQSLVKMCIDDESEYIRRDAKRMLMKWAEEDPEVEKILSTTYVSDRPVRRAVCDDCGRPDPGGAYMENSSGRLRCQSCCSRLGPLME